jgi:hypothetical protein
MFAAKKTVEKEHDASGSLTRQGKSHVSIALVKDPQERAGEYPMPHVALGFSVPPTPGEEGVGPKRALPMDP